MLYLCDKIYLFPFPSFTLTFVIFFSRIIFSVFVCLLLYLSRCLIYILFTFFYRSLILNIFHFKNLSVICVFFSLHICHHAITLHLLTSLEYLLEYHYSSYIFHYGIPLLSVKWYHVYVLKNNTMNPRFIMG